MAEFICIHGFLYSLLPCLSCVDVSKCEAFGIFVHCSMFFYICGLHQHRHVYLIFVIYVLVILIGSIYWMSWFTVNQDMNKLQTIFIMAHSLIYVLFFI